MQASWKRMWGLHSGYCVALPVILNLCWRMVEVRVESISRTAHHSHFPFAWITFHWVSALLCSLCCCASTDRSTVLLPTVWKAILLGVFSISCPQVEDVSGSEHFVFHCTHFSAYYSDTFVHKVLCRKHVIWNWDESLLLLYYSFTWEFHCCTRLAAQETV